MYIHITYIYLQTDKYIDKRQKMDRQVDRQIEIDRDRDRYENPKKRGIKTRYRKDQQIDRQIDRKRNRGTNKREIKQNKWQRMVCAKTRTIKERVEMASR